MIEIPNVKPDLVLAGVEATDRSSLYRRMLQAMTDNNLLAADQQESVLSLLMNREEKITTAIGNGIAVPHTSVKGLPRTVSILAKMSQAIDCGAPDNQPVELFFMLLVPAEDYGTHLRTMAGVSKFFRQDGIREKLRSAKVETSLRALFS